MKMLIILLFCLILHQSSAQSVICPDDFTLVLGNKCLSPVRYLSSHSLAENNCRSFGGTLVNVHNAVENRAIVTFATTNDLGTIWIGSYCFGNTSASCYNDDYSESGYSSFASGFPDGKECVFMTTTGAQAGQWFTSNCEDRDAGNSYICEVPTTFYGGDIYRCNNFDGNCYFIEENWLTDGEICNHASIASITSIHSKRENDFIQHTFSNYQNVLIGASRSPLHSYAWSDGTPFGDFDNRDLLSPDTITDPTWQCLKMNTVDGLWSLADCMAKAYIVCKKQIIQNDMSQCNSTMVMAPTVITSYAYGKRTPPIPCTWRIVAPGPYRVRVSFVDASVNSNVLVYDETGAQIANVSSPTTVTAPTNQVTVVSGGGIFKANILAL